MDQPLIDTFLLESPSLNDHLEITIALPVGLDPEGGRTPVIYVLDPIVNFQPVVAAANYLFMGSTMFGGNMPRVIVAGIGYAVDHPGQIMAKRARDLTPSAGKSNPIKLPRFPHGVGGAARFLDVLSKQVLPEVESRYPADPKNRTLVGHSFGGLFSLYTLFHSPDMFSRYLCVSPSLWWDNKLALRYEQAWADGHQDLAAKVFLAVGREEQSKSGSWRNEGAPNELLAAARQVENLSELALRLEMRKYQHLDLAHAVLSDEYHFTVMPTAITRGLLFLHDRAWDDGP